jgi:hypothetical protein
VVIISSSSIEGMTTIKIRFNLVPLIFIRILFDFSFGFTFNPFVREKHNWLFMRSSNLQERKRFITFFIYPDINSSPLYFINCLNHQIKDNCFTLYFKSVHFKSLMLLFIHWNYLIKSSLKYFLIINHFQKIIIFSYSLVTKKVLPFAVPHISSDHQDYQLEIDFLNFFPWFN